MPELGLTNLSHHFKQKALLDHLVWISVYHISLSGWIQQLQLKLTWSWADIKVSFSSSVAEAVVIKYQSEFQNLYWNTCLCKKVDGWILSLLFFYLWCWAMTKSVCYASEPGFLIVNDEYGELFYSS